MSTTNTTPTRTHTCPGGCGSQVAHHLFACAVDWARLPTAIRNRISRTYRTNPTAHFEAMSDAMHFYDQNPMRHTPMTDADRAVVAELSKLAASIDVTGDTPLSVRDRIRGRIYQIRGGADVG